MLQADLLVLHMGRFEYFDKFLVLWFEKFQNSLKVSQEIFCIGQVLGHKCLEVIVISDPVSRRPENLEALIWIFICGRAY